MPNRPKAVMISTVSNSEKNLLSDLRQLERAFLPTFELKYVVVESDSMDATPKIIEKLSKKYPESHFVSIGNTRMALPKRVSRISNARNFALSISRESGIWDEIDYVVLADMDGRNRFVSPDAIRTVFDKIDDWDACMANQAFYYYDIWALRHDVWSPDDCWEKFKELLELGIPRNSAYQAAVTSRMLHIPKDSPWIRVQSAYGGLAIYRKELLDNYNYDLQKEGGLEICDHVPLNLDLSRNGAKLFIASNLINGPGHRFLPGSRKAIFRGLFTIPELKTS